MTDEQAVAIIAAICLAADNIRGGMRTMQAALDHSGDGYYEPWQYDTDECAIAKARELLALTKTRPDAASRETEVRVGASRPTGDSTETET